MITYGLPSQNKSEKKHIWASSEIHQSYARIDLDAIGHEMWKGRLELLDSSEMNCELNSQIALTLNYSDHNCFIG